MIIRDWARWTSVAAFLKPSGHVRGAGWRWLWWADNGRDRNLPFFGSWPKKITKDGMPTIFICLDMSWSLDDDFIWFHMISFSNPSFGDHCDLFAYSHFLMDPLGERFRAWEPASIYLHHLISHVQYKRYVYCIILRYIIYNYILGIRCVYIYN